MVDLRVRPHAPDADGAVLEVTPESAGWRHVGFKVVRLEPGQTYVGGEAGREACLVIVAGSADVAAGDERFSDIGGRTTPFEDRAPGAVYVPAGLPYSVSARSAVELAVCTAPGSGAGEPRRIENSDMSREVRGAGTNTRYVRNILPETQPAGQWKQGRLYTIAAENQAEARSVMDRLLPRHRGFVVVNVGEAPPEPAPPSA